jgi:hypothetical protein
MTVTPTRLAGDLAQTSIGLTGAQTQVLGLMEWTIDWKVKNVDATTTDDNGNEFWLPSTRSWTAKAKYAYIDGDTSQAAQILNRLQTSQALLTWNFFPTVALGRGCWVGLASIESCTITAGSGKVVAIDISLKGAGACNFQTQLAPGGTGTTQAES